MPKKRGFVQRCGARLFHVKSTIKFKPQPVLSSESGSYLTLALILNQILGGSHGCGLSLRLLRVAYFIFFNKTFDLCHRSLYLNRGLSQINFQPFMVALPPCPFF